jgi:hypothetical protein
MGYIFDGYNSTIILDSPEDFDIEDMYSRWKDWVLDGYAVYSPAFRTLGGDPISTTQTVAPYFFLNTTEGWKIRPYESNHSLSIDGNLYAEDPTHELFTPTLGGYTVLITIERSSAAIGFEVNSGSGLSTEEHNWLDSLYKNIPLQILLGLRK